MKATLLQKATALATGYSYPITIMVLAVLDTSAMHMVRAMGTFQNMGMRPIPAPTDYILKIQTQESPGNYLPDMGNLDLARHLLCEQIGTIWTNIKSRLDGFR